MGKLWIWKYNFVRGLYEAFFCVEKNGQPKSFSSKKFFAFVLLTLAVGNHLHLHLWAESHWVVVLHKSGVDNIVTTALITSLDVLAGWAQHVYMKGKSNGAA